MELGLQGSNPRSLCRVFSYIYQAAQSMKIGKAATHLVITLNGVISRLYCRQFVSVLRWIHFDDNCLIIR